MVIRQIDVHHAAAADAAQVGLTHAHCESGGHRRVHGVAAGLQDLQASLRGVHAAAGYAAVGADGAVSELIALHGLRDLGGLRLRGSGL